MDVDGPKLRPKTIGRQGGSYFPSPDPEHVVPLRNLSEIRQGWGATAEAIYRAVRLKRLRVYARDGRRAYYSEAELTDYFKTAPQWPTEPPRPSIRKKNTGGYPRHSETEFEFETQRDDVAA